MRSFRFYLETEPGLLVRRTALDHIADEMRRLAPELAQHYRTVWGRPELTVLRKKAFKSVLAMGGGHPSFEANGPKAKQITVIDEVADVYEDTHEIFAGANPGAPKVVYTKGDIRTASMEGADLVTFCHVLEHVSIAEATAVLKKAAATAADILIYGPNADYMQSDGWLHALPVHEHVWLAGIGWSKDWAEATTGRTAEAAITHDFDLCIWLPAPKPVKPTVTKPTTKGPKKGK